MAQSTTYRRRPRVRPTVDGARTIVVEPLDTDGRDLRLHTGATDHRPVSSLVLHLGTWHVELHILAASHCVAVRTLPDAGERPELLVSETVACGTTDAAVDHSALPAGYRWSSNGWQMQFSSTTVLGIDEVRAAARQLELLRDVESAIVGRFPGDDLALTALVADLQTRNEGPDAGAQELAWHSWHLYPGSSPHAVITHTIACPPAGSRPSKAMIGARKDPR